MANLDFDLAGLLTGVSNRRQEAQSQQQAQGQPIPGTPNFRGMFGAQMANELSGGIGKLVRGGKPTQQQQVQDFITNVDRNDPEQLAQLTKVLRASGEHERADKIELKIQKLQEKAATVKQRGALTKMAKAQSNPNMAAWLEAGGDVKTAASVLLKQPKLATPEAYASMFTKKGKVVRTAVIEGKLSRATESGWTTIKDDEELFATDPTKKEAEAKASNLSSSDIETYESLIELNPEVKKAVSDIGWFDSSSVDKDKKRVLINKAEEIFTNNPKLGREGALLQAAKIEKAQEANVSSDPDSNVTVK